MAMIPSRTRITIGTDRVVRYLICVFVFLYIYTPLVVLPFNVTHLLSLVALSVLLLRYTRPFLSMLNAPELVVFITLQLFVVLYSLVMNGLGGGNFSTTYFAGATLFEVLPCAIFISFILLALKIDLMEFYDFILVIGVLQVACVVLALAFPGVRDWILSDPGNKAILDAEGTLNKFRMFGLARGYTFSMPLFQGLCVIIAAVSGAYRSRRYYLLIPLYLFSIALNARIALVSVFVVSLVMFCFRFRKHFLRQIGYVLFLVLLIVCAVQFIEYKASTSSSFDVWAWMYSAIDEIISFAEGHPKEGLSSLTDTMWFSPKGIQLLFGTGETVFGREYKGSDIGYVINLYYGGIVFSAALYLSYLVLLLKSPSRLLFEKVVNVSVVVYLFIANLKGNVFMPNEVVNGVLLLLVFSIARKKFQEETPPALAPAGSGSP